MLGLVVFLVLIVVKALADPEGLHVSLVFVPFYYAAFFAFMQTCWMTNTCPQYKFSSGCECDDSCCECDGCFDYFVLPNIIFVAPILYLGVLIHCRIVYGSGTVRGSQRGVACLRVCV